MKQLNRLKKTRRQFEVEQFYIHETDNGVYQFRHKETHMAISTSCLLSELENNIRKIFNRYRNYDLLEKSIREMSEKVVSPKEFGKRELEYKKKRHEKFNGVIDTLIGEYYKGKETKRTTPLVDILIPSQTVVENNTRTPEPTRVNRIKHRKSRL